MHTYIANRAHVSALIHSYYMMICVISFRNIMTIPNKVPIRMRLNTPSLPPAPKNTNIKLTNKTNVCLWIMRCWCFRRCFNSKRNQQIRATFDSFVLHVDKIDFVSIVTCHAYLFDMLTFVVPNPQPILAKLFG